MATCNLCDRNFPDQHSLTQHRKTFSQHAWCERCQKAFKAGPGRQQHLRDSPRHNICLSCANRPDFKAYADLETHLAKVHHGCAECDEFFTSPQGLTDHDVAEHNMCLTCHECFESPSNLKSHLITHKPNSLECFGCLRKFKSTSGMLIHLEAGTCGSGRDRDDVERIAIDCHQSQQYTSSDEEWLFECPGCETPFNSMSGLFQHVESDSCEETVTDRNCLGKFLKFLRTSI